MPTTPAISTHHNHAGAHHAEGTNTANSNTAVPILLRSGVMDGVSGMPSRRGSHLLACAAKTAFTGSIGCDRFVQRRRIVVRPHLICEIKLSVGQLPQQK